MRSILLATALLLVISVGGWMLWGRAASSTAEALLPDAASLDLETEPSLLDATHALAPELDALRRARVETPASTMSGSNAPAAPSMDATSMQESLLDLLATLEEQAAAGDANAACLVAESLSTCRRLRRLDGYRPVIMEQARREMESPNRAQSEAAERMLGELERQLEWSQRCEELGDEVLALQPYVDVRAARSGATGAARRFVSGEGVGAGNLVQDPSLATYYRDHAWSLFQGMLDAGDPAAVLMLDEAISRRADSMLWAVMPDEWKRTDLVRAMRFRLEERYGEFGRTAGLDKLDPQVVAEADAVLTKYYGEPGTELRPIFSRRMFEEPSEVCEPSAAGGGADPQRFL